MKPTERFSNRADLYDRFRPRYAQAIIPFLEEAIGLSSQNVVADIGSGTGILSDLFLQNGNTVLKHFAVALFRRPTRRCRGIPTMSR